MRIVFDTNVLVSALLLENSTPALALNRAEDMASVLYSEAILKEISAVLSRPKLQAYIEEDDVTGFLARIYRSWEKIAVVQAIHACRDPKDDKFLEVAVSGGATYIVSGDKDLLGLHPFRGIDIVTPAYYLLEMNRS